MNLVVFNMSNYLDWEEGVVNRNFFIVQELIQRPEIEQVVLVDFLAIQSIKKIFGLRRTSEYAKDILISSKGRPSRKGQRIGLTHSLSKLEHGPFFLPNKPVYLFQGLGISQSAANSIQKLRTMLQSLGYKKENTILWSYNAFLPEAFELDACVKVFDAVDNWASHASYKKEAGRLIENYKKIDRAADIVFTVSEKLQDTFNNAPTHWIPNGVNLSLFQKDVEAKTKLDQPQPIVGYVGTIQERIDFALLEKVCQAHSDKSFVFIGPIWSGVEDKVDDLKKACANVFFLGRRSYDEIPSLLKQVDVAIIPHRLDSFIHSTNPMKMYDYLAAGKPVVTTPGAGTEMFSNLLSIQKDSQGFIEAINRELANNSPQVIEQRLQAAAQHSWKTRVDAMMEGIAEFC